MLRHCLCLLLFLFAHVTDAGAVDEAALRDALVARLEQAAAAGFSGSVLVADGSRVLFERSYGVADPAAGTPVAAGTRFNLASSGKLFTTIAVLQLVQQGKLDLDAPVGRYLPDWPVTDVRDRVSLRQLLLHTSGLGSYWGPEFEALRTRLQSLADYAPLLQKPPAFEPGSRWQYSNSGFQILGLVVEAVSGEDYYGYVARHIFDAAGMRDSGYFTVDGQARGVAVPHKGGRGEDRLETFARMPEPRGGAAGGGYSTPRDLLLFHRALTGGTLLDAPRRALLFAAADIPGPREGRPPHGLGLLRVDAGSDVIYGHPGGARGIGVDFRAARDSGWALVLLSNVSEPFALALGNELAGIIEDAGGADLRFPMPAPRPRERAAPRH